MKYFCNKLVSKELWFCIWVLNIEVEKKVILKYIFILPLSTSFSVIISKLFLVRHKILNSMPYSVVGKFKYTIKNEIYESSKIGVCESNYGIVAKCLFLNTFFRKITS